MRVSCAIFVSLAIHCTLKDRNNNSLLSAQRRQALLLLLYCADRKFIYAI